MTDLRTGLVEAISDAFIDCNNNGEDEIEEYAEAALDALLGFLTDNAEATKAMQRGLGALPLDDRYDHSRNARHLLHALLAALSDSRDTGEKP